MADNQDYGGGEGGKRSAEDQRQNQNKRPRGDYNQVVFRLMIRSNNAGGVIGKGGDNIKRLRSDYDAKVSIPDCNGPERIIKIVTKQLDSALDCISDIIPKVGEKVERRDRKQDQSQNQGQFFVRIMVHQSHAGAIIGRAGFKIKELREKTGAHFKVYTKTCPNSTDRVVQLTGTADVIIKAAREVYEICSETPIKGLAQEYDPFNHDTSNFDQYGGFLFDPAEESYGDRGGYGGDRGGGGGGQWNRGPPMGRGYDRGMAGGNDNFGYGRSPFGGGGGGPMGGGRGRGGRGRGGGGGPGGARGYGREQQYGGAQGYDFGGDSGRGQSNFGGGGGGFDGGPGGGGGGGEAVQTQQVTIPNDLAGSIIGRGGQRIKKIRTQSGAQIKIDDPLQGAKDRIITITGTQHDIAHAKFLLQNSVKEYQNSGGAVQ
nr:heterogeneous nuclear ribonucleoprotein K-like [Lytechinus pictus]